MAVNLLPAFIKVVRFVRIFVTESETVIESTLAFARTEAALPANTPLTVAVKLLNLAVNVALY